MPRDPRRIHAGDEAISAANWRDLVIAARLINGFTVGNDMTAWKTAGGGLSIKNTGPLPPLPHNLNRRGSARITLTSGPYSEDGTNLDLKDLSVSEPAGFTANSSYLVGYRSVFDSDGVLTSVNTSTNILPYTETSGDNPLFRLGRIKTGGTPSTSDPVSIIQVFQDWQGGTIERGETPTITPDADSPNPGDVLFLSTINYRPVDDDHEGELQLYGVRNVHEDNYGIPFIQPDGSSGGMRWLTPDSDRWYGASAPVGSSAGRVKSIAKRRGSSGISTSTAALEIWGFYDHADSGDMSTSLDFRLLARHPTGLNAQSTSGEVIYPDKDQVARWLASSVAGITPDANSDSAAAEFLKTINFRPVNDAHEGELQLFRSQVVPINTYGIPFLATTSGEGSLDWLVPDADAGGDELGAYRSLVKRTGLSTSRPALEIYKFRAAPDSGALPGTSDIRVLARLPTANGADVIYPNADQFGDWIQGEINIFASQIVDSSNIVDVLHKRLKFGLTVVGIAGNNRDHNNQYWPTFDDAATVDTKNYRTTQEVRVGTLALNAQPASLWNPTAFTVVNTGTASITTSAFTVNATGAVGITSTLGAVDITSRTSATFSTVNGDLQITANGVGRFLALRSDVGAVNITAGDDSAIAITGALDLAPTGDLQINGVAGLTAGSGIRKGIRIGQMAAISDIVGGGIPAIVAKINEILAGDRADGIRAV